MKNIIQFSGLAQAISEQTLEPVVDIVGLVTNSDQGVVLLDLSMKGDSWVPVAEADFHHEVEHLGEKRVKGAKEESKYSVMRFRLQRDASKELMWSVIQDLQRSLNSARAAYEAELRRKGHTVMTGDSLVTANCECNQGDKCCCPDGYKCCNYDKRCCCSSE